MGKCCLHASSFIFDRIIIKVAGNQDRHKSSDEFDFGSDQTTHFVTCPWMTKILHFRTWISLRPVGQSSSNFMCIITGVGKGCIMFWGWLDQNSCVHGNRKLTLTYNGENCVSTFSRLLLIQSFLYLQVTRTCIKSRTSSNCGQIGPLTTELAAFERLKISHRLIISFLIESSPKLLVTRTGIKARSSSILGRIRSLILELLALEWRKLHTFELEYLWSQLANLDQILWIASGWGERLHTGLGQIGSKQWFPWLQKAPIDL